MPAFAPPPPLTRGPHSVRAATGAADVAAALALRAQMFRDGGADGDAFDADALHVLVQDTATGRVTGAFRLIPMASGADIDQGYAAQSYDLTALHGYGLPVLELGRFCLSAQVSGDPDLLRLAWAYITRAVDDWGVGMLCGCTSFKGADPAPHAQALAALAAHAAPAHLAPRIKTARPVRLADLPPPADPVKALAQMPPLLRTYLTMGGWVSDHAVPDPDLDTLHVFTAVEIAAIPPARARLLRALAG